MGSAIPDLPVEILSLIVDAVASLPRQLDTSRKQTCGVSPTSTLHSCLLVSRVFYCLARRHIFSHIRISFHPFYRSDSAHTRLRDIFRGNPSVLSEIKSVEIVFDSDGPHAFCPRRPGPPTARGPQPSVGMDPFPIPRLIQGKTPFLRHPVLNEILTMLSGHSIPAEEAPGINSRQPWKSSFRQTLSFESNTPKPSIQPTFHSLTIRSAPGQHFRLAQLHEEIVVSLIRLRTQIPALTHFHLESVISPPHALLVGTPEFDTVRHLVVKDVHFSSYAPVPTQQSDLPWERSGPVMDYEWARLPPLATTVACPTGRLASPTYSSRVSDTTSINTSKPFPPPFPFAALESIELNAAKLLHTALQLFKGVPGFGSADRAIKCGNVNELLLHLSVWDPTIPPDLISSWFPALTVLSLRLSFDASDTPGDIVGIRLSDFPVLTTVKISVLSTEYTGNKLPADDEHSSAIDCLSYILGTADFPNDIAAVVLEVKWLVDRPRLSTVGPTPLLETVLHRAPLWDSLRSVLDDNRRYPSLQRFTLDISLKVDGVRYRELSDGAAATGAFSSFVEGRDIPKLLSLNRSGLSTDVSIKVQGMDGGHLR